MRVTQRGFLGLLIAAAMSWTGTAGAAHPTAAQRCEAAMLTAAGKKEACLANERAREVQGNTPRYAQCDADFTNAVKKAESQAGVGVCPSDVEAIEALIDRCFDDLKSTLAGSPNPPCEPGAAFPATGQTTCWNSAGTIIPCAGTGHDGDIRAGSALSYTDNGDGTITDNNTRLTWEKKSDDGTIHDKDTTYTWANAFTTHIVGLNAGAGFAGHTDWRLPNVKELHSLMNLEQQFSPGVSAAFNTACMAGCTVLTCSCTATDYHWTSTTYVPNPPTAWVVDFIFGVGYVIARDKAESLRVRAVRGGL